MWTTAVDYKRHRLMWSEGNTESVKWRVPLSIFITLLVLSTIHYPLSTFLLTGCTAEEIKPKENPPSSSTSSPARLVNLQQEGARFFLKGAVVVQLAPGVVQEGEGTQIIQDVPTKELFLNLRVEKFEPTTYQIKGGLGAPKIPNLYRLTLPIETNIMTVCSALQKNPQVLFAKPIQVKFPKALESLSNFPKFQQWNFEPTAPGELTKDFAAVSSIPEEPGEWVFQEGNLTQIHAKAVPNLLHFALLIPYSDHDLKMSVKIKPISGSLNKGGGVLFRFDSFENYYRVGLDFIKNLVHLERVAKGTHESLMVAKLPDNKEEWYTLEVVSQGVRFVAFVNGVPLINQTDDKLWHGRVGLWTEADATTSFDDFTVQAIQ